jgi:hypothetical protein
MEKYFPGELEQNGRVHKEACLESDLSCFLPGFKFLVTLSTFLQKHKVVVF